MSETHTFTETWTGAGKTIQSEKSFTAASQTTLSEPIPTPSTDLKVNIAIDVSEVKGIIILCDQDITLKTNSAGSPDDTLILKAKVAYTWNPDKVDALKLTVDVTAFFITLAGGTAGTLDVAVLQDPTP